MKASTDDFFAGVPVPVDPIEIERELAALWKPASSEKGGEGAVVRACLANLICFLPDSRDRARAEQMFLKVSRDHPNRTILLCSNPRGWDEGDDSSRLRAFVTAVCSAPVRGRAPVCCERITLEARAQDASLFSGAVAPLLVPDVPVFLWWAGGRHDDPLLPELSAHVDRVIVNTRRDAFGSGSLKELQAQLGQRRVREIVDLGWRGLERWRRAVADLFDDPALRSSLPQLRDIELEWAPDDDTSTSTAIDESALLAGWVASRLGLELRKREDRGDRILLDYRRADPASTVRLSLAPRRDSIPPGMLPGEPVSLKFGLDSGGGRAELALRILADDPETVEISYRNQEMCHVPTVRSFVRPDNGELLLGILSSPTHPQVFGEALNAALGVIGGE